MSQKNKGSFAREKNVQECFYFWIDNYEKSKVGLYYCIEWKSLVKFHNLCLGFGKCFQRRGKNLIFPVIPFLIFCMLFVKMGHFDPTCVTLLVAGSYHAPRESSLFKCQGGRKIWKKFENWRKSPKNEFLLGLKTISDIE